MELQRAQELIRQLKEIKEQNELTYPRIMDRIEKNGKSVSLLSSMTMITITVCASITLIRTSVVTE